MKAVNTDVLVCGGGISGLLTAKSLVNLGLSVVCLEKSDTELKSKEGMADGRSTAFLQPSIDFLSDLGLWRNLSSKAQGLESLVLCNLNPETHTIDESCEFLAHDLNLEHFGYNLTNDFLISELKKTLATESKFQFLGNVTIQNLVQRSKEIIVLTNQQQRIRSKLVIGADGKNGTLRELANIGIYGIDYNQQALVFSIDHEFNHEARSLEIYESGGPCTLVPNKTYRANGYSSSVVLMQNSKEIRTTMHLDKEDMSRFVTKRTGMLLGECEIKTGIRKFPVLSQISKKFTGERLLLLAESAHVMPPIGAQGLNCSIQDIKILTDIIALKVKGDRDFGSKDLLHSYERARGAQIRSKMLGIHVLNKVSMNGNGLTLAIRKLGLRAFSKNLGFRKIVMNLGMYEKFKPII